MSFVATCIDMPNNVPLRMEARPARLAYLNGLGTRVKAGGATVTPDQQSPLGSLPILEGESEAEIAALLADDPHALAGRFERVDIKPWRQAVGATLA